MEEFKSMFAPDHAALSSQCYTCNIFSRSLLVYDSRENFLVDCMNPSFCIGSWFVGIAYELDGGGGRMTF